MKRASSAGNWAAIQKWLHKSITSNKSYFFGFSASASDAFWLNGCLIQKQHSNILFVVLLQKWNGHGQGTSTASWTCGNFLTATATALDNFGSGMKCLGRLCRFSGVECGVWSGGMSFTVSPLAAVLLRIQVVDPVDQECIELLKLEDILPCLA